MAISRLLVSSDRITERRSRSGKLPEVDPYSPSGLGSSCVPLLRRCRTQVADESNESVCPLFGVKFVGPPLVLGPRLGFLSRNVAPSGGTCEEQ